LPISAIDRATQDPDVASGTLTLRRAERAVRYALLVTLRAPAEIDLYAEIENQIAIDVEIEG
jgi:hypothetical protein